MKTPGLVSSSRALAALSLLAVAPASAQIISLNFFEFASQHLLANQAYGVTIPGGLDSTAVNWVNINANSIIGVTDNSGQATAVDVAMTRPNGPGSFGAAYAGSPLIAGYDTFTATVNPPSVSFTNLSSLFPDGYVVVAYVNGFNTNTGSSVSDGTTTYYYRPANPAALPESLIQTKTTSEPAVGEFPVAQIAIFGTLADPLTSDSFSVITRALVGGGSGITGVQIVAIPEPSHLFALGGIAGAVFLLLRRRRG